MRDHVLEGVVVVDVSHHLGEGAAVDRLHDGADTQHAGAVDVADEVFDVGVVRVEKDMLRLALLDDVAVLQDDQVVGQLQGFVEVVCDEHDRLVEVLLQLEQEVLHVGADQRVEGGEGLVHEHDRRVRRQCAGDANTLLHAARELMGVVVLEAAEADAVEPLHAFLIGGCLVFTANAKRHAGVLQDGAVGQ